MIPQNRNVKIKVSHFKRMQYLINTLSFLGESNYENKWNKIEHEYTKINFIVCQYYWVFLIETQWCHHCIIYISHPLPITYFEQFVLITYYMVIICFEKKRRKMIAGEKYWEIFSYPIYFQHKLLNRLQGNAKWYKTKNHSTK